MINSTQTIFVKINRENELKIKNKRKGRIF